MRSPLHTLRAALGLSSFMILFLLPNYSRGKQPYVPPPFKVKQVQESTKSIILGGDWELFDPDHLAGDEPGIVKQNLSVILGKCGTGKIEYVNAISDRSRNRMIIIKFDDSVKLNQWVGPNSKIYTPYRTFDPRYKETYSIDISKKNNYNQILIAVGGPSGLFYAVQTLSRYTDKIGRIQIQTINDHPGLKLRGIMAELGPRFCDNLSGGQKIQETVECFQKKIESMLPYRMNTYFFRSQDYFDLTQDRITSHLNLFDFCRKHYIEPVPVLDSKLWGIPKKKIDINSVEGYWVRNEVFRFSDTGEAVPDMENNVLLEDNDFEYKTNNSNTIAWSVGSISNKNMWKIISDDSDTNKSSFAVCNVNNLKKSYRLKLSPSKATKNYISVEPSSYYEIGFSAKKKGLSDLKLRVLIKQYDRKKKYIKETGNSTNNYILKENWANRWHPIFTNLETKYIKITFMPIIAQVGKGQLFLDDLLLKRMNGSLNNIIQPDSLEVTNFNGEIAYVNGRDFILIEKTAQEISLGEVRPKKFVIKRPQTSTIPEKGLVRISYDTRMLEYVSVPFTKLCPSSIETYKFYHRTFSNLLALNPKYIHISMDEHYGGFNRDSRCKKRYLENHQIFSRFINSLNEILHSAGDIEVLPGQFVSGLGRPEIRLIMWDDMVNFWFHGNKKDFQIQFGGEKGRLHDAMPDALGDEIVFPETAQDILSKDIIMMSWWYKSMDQYQIIKKSPEFYHQRGFDNIGCTWDNPDNLKLWIQALKKRDSLGITVSTWGNKKQGIPFTAYQSWNALP